LSVTANAFERTWSVMGLDFTSAGRAATGIKDTLKRVGVDPSVVRRVATASYEAEMNVVMHARKGAITLRVSSESVVVEAADEGPGIPDIQLAMQEGYSTATPEMREMGFGAGMGLSNMKKNADDLEIDTVLGKGTLVRITVCQLRGRQA
jgi:anti-sigma regulatory factor (Ser/Thr protein kinase)